MVRYKTEERQEESAPGMPGPRRIEEHTVRLVEKKYEALQQEVEKLKRQKVELLQESAEELL